MKRRVVVTGIGVVAPNGIGKDAYWKALENGQSGIKNCPLFDASSLPNQAVGEVTDFNIRDFTDSKILINSGRACQFALSAANLALEDAQLNNIRSDRWSHYRKGVAFGTAFPAIDLFEYQLRLLLEKKVITPDQMNEFYSLCSSNPITMELVEQSGFDDFSITLSSACTAGSEAIFFAASQITQNNADIFICGGADAFLTFVMSSAFHAAGLSAQEPYEYAEQVSRPFDKKRSGGVNSEGAAVIVLEEFEAALQRGARIYGEIKGWSCCPKKKGKNNELETISGMEMSMKDAINRSGLKPSQIEYVSAHAPSLPVFDKLETMAIKRLFGDHAYKIPVSSIKSMIGNPMAAAGPMQLISALLGINKGIIPPTINYEFPDPECDLDYVPNQARRNEIENALIETHGLDGTNAVIVVKKFRC